MPTPPSSTARAKKRRASAQLPLAEPPRTWGGRRPGAGRPRAPGGKRSVPHRTRPEHNARHPVHVTLRARRHLPSLRAESVRRLVIGLLAPGRRHTLDDLRVLHFSVQRDHLHLIVEGGDRRRLSAGMRSFVIRFALRLNRLLGRMKGKVWAERYHRHDLTTPTETRNALAYVLANYKKHGVVDRDAPALDVFSTAGRFDGWSVRPPKLIETEPWPPRTARTWLLTRGWRRAGRPISPSDAPA
jgi:REP element-mobilizing transposase RayT